MSGMGWAPGTQVGDYEILGTIGNGGMGEVYKVRHVISDRVEALKVLLSGTAEKAISDRFVREIRVLAKLSHPHIAALHTAFQHQDQLVMVMEYVEGMSLGERQRRGLTLEQSVEFIRQVLSALEYAHASGVVHRDIKPSNVMIGRNEKAKLLDFGLALNAPDPRITSPRALVGSVLYISPEQISGGEADVRSDIYAVGVTLYELITGHLPIRGNTFAEILSNHLKLMPESPNKLNPSVPRNLAAVTMRALEKDPSKRYQSATEFLVELNGMRGALPHDAAVTVEDIFATLDSLPRMDVEKSPSPRPSGSSLKDVKPAVLDEISSHLATYIGPIAKVIVKRASSSSNNLRELCDQVAREIDSEKSRKSFLLSVQKHITASGQF
jgi:eukaryotic-like serine/threonine-protein kinase